MVRASGFLIFFCSSSFSLPLTLRPTLNMATTDDNLTKVSTDGKYAYLLPRPLTQLAATDFVQSFYPSLQSNRAAIASYYNDTISTILFNGNVVADGKAVQDIFLNQMPPTHYEVQSYDCQIINQAYPTPEPAGGKISNKQAAKNMSILVIVSGYVRFGETKDLPQRGFSETFVLVPNSGKTGKEWLIQSQNFRLVV